MGYHAGFLDFRRPETSLADDLRQSMAHAPRALPLAMAFDAVGHALYARVTALPHFTCAHAEAELLRVHAREILESAGAPDEIVDLSAGSGVQARGLLGGVERYVAVDPCRPVLEDAVDGLEAAFPRLRVSGIVGDPAFGLSAGSRNPGPRLALLLNGYLGRFDPTHARLELARLRGHFEPEDRLLVGFDFSKSDGQLACAYDDPTGVYAALARNALRRANREVGTDFRSADWRLVVEPQPERGRIEVRFEARGCVAVRGGRAGSGWDFLPGESLVVEHAYKPTEGQVAAMAVGAGFRVVRSWTDAPEGCGVFMLAP